MTHTKELIPEKRARHRAQVIVVSSGKGGVGKTIFAVNFGVELQSRGFRVLLFDADVNLSNVNLLVNIDETTDVDDFFERRVPVDQLIRKGVGGVDTLYVGETLNSIITMDDAHLETLLSSLVDMEVRYDFIIIDTQAGLTDLNVRLMHMADRVVMVTNPEITSLVDLYRVIKATATGKSGLLFEIIINRIVGPDQAAQVFRKISDTVSQFSVKASLSFLGFVVDDARRVIESIQKRVPIVLLHRSGRVHVCVKLITDAFLQRKRPKGRKPFFFGLLDRS